MQCPFCHCANARDTGACRVCGGPLRAAKPAPLAPSPILAAPSIVPIAPMPVAPTLLARQALEERAPVVAVGFCGDENQLIGLVLENGALQLWDVQNDEFASISAGRGFRKPGQICCAALAPNLVVTGYECGKVGLRALEPDPKRGAWKARALDLAPHVGRALALAITPKRLYSGGNDGVIWVTTLAAAENPKRRPSRELLDGLGTMTTLAVAPDGAALAVGGDDGAVRLWRLQTDDAVPRLDWTSRKFAAPVASLAFSPDGTLLIARAADHCLRLWAAQTNYPLPFAPQAQRSRLAPALAPDNRTLAIAGAQDGVSLFDIGTDKLLHILPTTGEARHLTFAPAGDEALLVVVSAREVELWKLP